MVNFILARAHLPPTTSFAIGLFKVRPKDKVVVESCHGCFQIPKRMPAIHPPKNFFARTLAPRVDIWYTTPRQRQRCRSHRDAGNFPAFGEERSSPLLYCSQAMAKEISIFVD